MRAPLLLCVVATAVWAGDLTPESVAKIDLEQKKANEAIDKKYGNKKPSELSSAERKEIIKERGEAEKAVFEKAGVDPKEYTKYTAKMNREDRVATKAAAEKLEQQEKEAAAKDARKSGPKEIVVQKGFSDNNPVTMEEKESDGVTVEHGLPPEASSDQAEAGGSDAPKDSSSATAPKK